MIGSTFISEADESKLTGVSPDELDDFAHVELDRMTTIDFAVVLSPAGVKWQEDGDPVFYSEGDGAALAKISESGLSYVLEHIADFPSEHHADLRKLASFVKEHGSAHIYEYATF